MASIAPVNLLSSLQFISTVPDGSLLYVGLYDYRLVVVSFLIVVFASFTALEVAGRVRAIGSGWTHMLWLLLGAVAMGGGIWAMHFVGMLALNLPCSVAYDPWLTGLSMLPGMLAGMVILWHISRTPTGIGQLALDSLLMGAGIGAMHYSGMAAMRFAGMVHYDPNLFVASIGVAVGLSFVALLVRFRMPVSHWRDIVAALVLGLAVTGMHYVAMAAAYFVREGDSTPPDAMNPAWLAMAVIIVVLILIGMTLTAAILHRQMQLVRWLRDSEHKLRRVLDTTQEGFWMTDMDGFTIEINAAMCHMIGRQTQEVIGRGPGKFVETSDFDVLKREFEVLKSGEKRVFTARLRHSSGGFVTCRFSASPMLDAQGHCIGTFALVSSIEIEQQYAAYQRQAVAVFENTSEGIMLTDARGVIQSINQSFTDVTGYPREEVIGRNPSMLQSGRQDAAFYSALWKEVNETGRWCGEIWNRRKNGEIYPEWLTISAVREGEHGAILNYIAVFSDISQMKKSEEELRKLAHFDPLTGLANRALLGIQLTQALQRAKRDQAQLAVMMLDLDGFKDVNDSLGHPVGDMLLKVVARRLKQELRSSDTISRMGGDEFAIVIESVSAAEDVAAIAAKLGTSIAMPYELGEQTARVTTSIGIALYPSDGEDDVLLMRSADTALYVAKRQGRNTYRFHDARMAEAVQNRVAIEQGLREALATGGFEVWYQPKIDLRTQAVIGAEALVRWRHSERGLVSPVEFIPVAEDTGLIIPIGEWVLREACRQTMDWLATGIDIGVISVNLDGAQIERSNILDTVERALSDIGIPAQRLELEITESLLLENAERGMGTVAVLHEMGVGVALDDFGTGYSSLAYLKFLRADRLKIDRSFIQSLPDDADDATIARTVISLAGNLGFQVIAEGVETEAQEKFLFAEGCFEVQGYRYSKPLPAAEFAAWFRARADRATLPAPALATLP